MAKRYLILVALGLLLTSALVYRTLQQEDASTAGLAPQAQNAVAPATQQATLAADQSQQQIFSPPQMPSYVPGSAGAPTVISIPEQVERAIRLTLMAPPAVKQGETFNVAINGETSAPAHHYVFTVHFDPGTLKALGANAGNFMEQGSALAKFVENAGTNGQLTIDVEQDGGSGVEGSGSLAVIQFQALSPGSTNIELSQIEVADGQGNPIVAAAPAPYAIKIDN
jgi:hypothetical protein